MIRSRFATPVFLILLGASSLGAPIDAVAAAKEDRQLGFTVPGRVARVEVVPGQRVEADQPLLVLDDRVSAARVEVNRIRAESELGVELAEAEWKLAASMEQRVRTAHASDAADATELDDAVLETRRRFLRLELARQQRDEANRELAIAELMHKHYMLHAPIAGIVEEITVAAGELVDDLQGVLRLVVTDPLIIDVSVPIRETLDISTGDRALVGFRLLPDAPPVVGRVTQLSAIADIGSGSRRVRVEVPNPHDLPAGCLVRVSFGEAEAQAAPGFPAMRFMPLAAMAFVPLLSLVRRERRC